MFFKRTFLLVSFASIKKIKISSADFKYISQTTVTRFEIRSALIIDMVPCYGHLAKSSTATRIYFAYKYQQSSIFIYATIFLPESSLATLVDLILVMSRDMIPNRSKCGFWDRRYRQKLRHLNRNLA